MLHIPEHGGLRGGLGFRAKDLQTAGEFVLDSLISGIWSIPLN